MPSAPSSLAAMPLTGSLGFPHVPVPTPPSFAAAFAAATAADDTRDTLPALPTSSPPPDDEASFAGLLGDDVVGTPATPTTATGVAPFSSAPAPTPVPAPVAAPPPVPDVALVDDAAAVTAALPESDDDVAIDVELDVLESTSAQPDIVIPAPTPSLISSTPFPPLPYAVDSQPVSASPFPPLPVAPPPPADDDDSTSQTNLGAVPPLPETALPHTPPGVERGDAAFVIDVGPQAPFATPEPFAVTGAPPAIDAPAPPPLVDDAFDIDVGTGRFNAPDLASAASLAPETPVAVETNPVGTFSPPADEAAPEPGLPVAVGLDVGDESFGDVPLLVVDEAQAPDAPRATPPFANIEPDPASPPGAAVLPAVPAPAVPDDSEVGESTVDGFSVEGFSVDGPTADAQTVKDGLAIDGLRIDGAPPDVRPGNEPALAEVTTATTTTLHASVASDELDIDFAIEPEAMVAAAAPTATADVPATLATAAPAVADDVPAAPPPQQAIDLAGGGPVSGPPAVGDGSLSSRAGALAEALEGEGRFTEAALLYEIQNVLSAIGR